MVRRDEVRSGRRAGDRGCEITRTVGKQDRVAGDRTPIQIRELQGGMDPAIRKRRHDLVTHGSPRQSGGEPYEVPWCVRCRGFQLPGKCCRGDEGQNEGDQQVPECHVSSLMRGGVIVGSSEGSPGGSMVPGCWWYVNPVVVLRGNV